MVDGTTRMSNHADGNQRLARRAVMGGAAAAAAGGLAARMGVPILAAAQDATPTADEGGRATFVLVAGSFAGGWIWGKVVPLLQAAGHEVYAATLTGLGDRVHLADPAIDLDVHVTDLANLLEYEDLHEVILVGHSSGGVVITAVAERIPERLAYLVYLDAMVPADGQSDFDFSIATEEARAEAVASTVAAGWAAGTPGLAPVDAGVEEFIGGMLEDPDDTEWVLSKLTPHPFAAWTQPISLGNPAAAALPHAYLYCTEGKGPADEDWTVSLAERLRSDPAWTYLEIPANHMVLVNDPKATAEALLSLL